MAGFNVVSELFETIDNALEIMVSGNVATMIEIATPIIAILLCCKFMTQGIFMMLNPNGGEPLSELVVSFVKVAAILSFATAGGLYQTDLVHLAQTLPDAVASKLQGLNHTPYTGVTGIIDGGITNCIEAIKSEFKSGGLSANGLMAMVIGTILIIPTVIMGGLGAGFIIMAKVMLAVTLCLGPLALFCLLFEPTKQVFSKWVGLVINYCLVTIIMALVFSLLMELFANMITGLNNGNGLVDAISTVIGLCILTTVSVLVMFQVPQLAQSIGGGVNAGIGQAAQAAMSSMGGLNPVAGVTKAMSHGAPKGGSGRPGGTGSNPGTGSSSSGSSRTSGMARGSRGRAA